MSLWRMIPCALIACLVSTVTVPAEDGQGLVCRWDDAEGLLGAAYRGDEIVANGAVTVNRLVLQERGVDEKGRWTYTDQAVEAPEGKRSFDPAAKILTIEYEWGRVKVQYEAQKQRLTAKVTIENASARHLNRFDLELMRLKLPGKKERKKNLGIGMKQKAVEHRTVQFGSFGENLVVMVYESFGTPLSLWIDNPEKGAAGYPVRMQGDLPFPEPGESYVHPGGRPSIAPGEALTLTFSLRFGPVDMAVGDSLQATDEKLRRMHGAGADWPDRRPIGMLIASSVGHTSKTNPRGWFNDKRIDITTPEGKEAFRERAMKYADNSIRVLKGMDAQGMILWDVEGSENPHPVTYIGDPRLVEKTAPEMDAVADEFFGKFREAGLRTGVCIRPSRVYFDPEKKKWRHNTGSTWGSGVEAEYEDIRPEKVPDWLFYPVARRLADKIAYAKKRWGASIFYIDTNGIHRFYGQKPDMKNLWILLSAQMYRAVREEHPDVLLIPEHVWCKEGSGATTWAYAAPYMELDLRGYGTPAWVQRVFPKSFSVINVTDGPFDKQREKLVEAVRNGDILLFRGWFDCHHNPKTKSVYDEVGEAVIKP